MGSNQFLVLFVIFVSVMLFVFTVEECIGGLLGLTDNTNNTAKNDILSFIGIWLWEVS